MLKVVAFMKQVAEDYGWGETLVRRTYIASTNAIIAYCGKGIFLLTRVTPVVERFRDTPSWEGM